MLNQQDCQRLQQQARQLENRWTSPLPPAALWPLCLGREHLHRRIGLQERSAPASPGLLALESPLLPGKWLELPAEWSRGDWFRVERYQGRQACLIWELSLEAGPELSTLRLRLRYTLQPALQAPLQTYFKRLCQAIAQSLAELAAGNWPPLPETLAGAWPAFSRAQADSEGLLAAIERQLRLSGRVDPIALARRSASRLAQAFELMIAARRAHLLSPAWVALDADGEHALAGPGAPWRSPRWQLDASPAPASRGLRFAPDRVPAPGLWPCDEAVAARMFLWPGQERELPLSPDYGSRLEWSLGAASGSLRLRAGSAANLSLPGPATALIAPGGALHLRHEAKGSSPALCVLQQPPGRSGDLLACTQAAPLLAGPWPMPAEQHGFYLLGSKPLPAALATWLEGFLARHYGTRLAPGPKGQPLLLLMRGEDALACALGLLQVLRQAIARELALPRLALALSSGPGSLQPEAHGITLTGPRLEALSRLLTQAQGLDLLLAAELLPRLQSQLGPWQLTELSAGPERVFQLRPH